MGKQKELFNTGLLRRRNGSEQFERQAPVRKVTVKFTVKLLRGLFSNESVTKTSKWPRSTCILT